MRLIDVSEVMYGRYVEPLVGFILIYAVIVWHQMAGVRRFRKIVGVALLLGLAAAAILSPSDFTEMNSGGYWYWQSLRQWIHPAAACSLPLLIWALWLALRKRPAWAMLSLATVSALCTALIALHLHQSNRDSMDLRNEAKAIAAAAQTRLSPRTQLWIDPRTGAGSDEQILNSDYRLWLLRYELPETAVQYSGIEQTIRRGDLMLTFPNYTSRTPIWKNSKLALYLFN